MDFPSPATIMSCENISLASALTQDEYKDLLSLYNTSYPNWTLDDVFESDTSLYKRYIFRIFIDNFLVASRQVIVTSMSEKVPGWVRNIGIEQSVNSLAIGSRAIVHPLFRGNKLGTRLVRKLNQEVFSHFKVEMILGSSTSLAAIKLYQRLGAEIWSKNKIYLEDQKRYFSGHERSRRLLLPVHYYYLNPEYQKQKEIQIFSISGNSGSFELDNAIR